MFNKFLNWLDENVIKLYFKTLKLIRINKQEWEPKPRKNKWWHRGGQLVAVITTRCTILCLEYCPMFAQDDSLKDGEYKKYPRYEISTLDEWKKYFENFPHWLSQIYISGGEPTLVPYLSDLINWLVDRGHHVCLFSNLAVPETLFGVKKHWRFVCVATFHSGDGSKRYDKKDRFMSAIKKLDGRFRIICQELEDEHKLKISKHKTFYSNEWFMNTNTLLHVAPDAPRTGKLYLGCVRLYFDGKVKK